MAKPKLGVFKFASCDGCQLSLLDCEDELLTVAGAVEISYFPEASRAMVRGPYDLSLVEGSITTPHDVDLVLRGCPISRQQLLETVSAFLYGRKPNVPPHSVCIECKRRGNVCVMVAHGTPCLGPVTQTGCGALFPAYDRGCHCWV